MESTSKQLVLAGMHRGKPNNQHKHMIMEDRDTRPIELCMLEHSYIDTDSFNQVQEFISYPFL